MTSSARTDPARADPALAALADPALAGMIAAIEDRSAALRAAAVSAGLGTRVPGCPDWTVRALVAHLGEVQRFWAATVSAGPADAPPADDLVREATPTGDLMAWSAAATAELARTLAAAGPQAGCWTWWRTTTAPSTSGAVARHQVQEAGVHAFDAQEAAGHAEPLPPGVAGDGIAEFLTVGMATMGPWPHEPGSVALAPADGAPWVVSLDEAGARAVQRDSGDGSGQPGSGQPGALIRGSASDIVLALYGRTPHQVLIIEGDRELATRLLTWTDNE